ncbi:MAG: FAD:protein FMN transferase [Bacillota bacterium]
MNSKVMTIVSVGIILVIVGVGFFLQQDENKAVEDLEEYQDTEMILDTINTIRIYDSDKKEAVDAAFDEVKEIDELFNIYNEESEIAQINETADEEPAQLGTHTYEVLVQALEHAEITEGAFDPTIGSLIKLWGWGSDDGPSVPTNDEIEEILPLVNHKELNIDHSNKTVFFNKSGMMIDLGAIAKGYAAELAAESLQDNGVETAFVNLGGNIVLIGTKPDQSPWKIGVQNPSSDRGALMGVITAESNYFSDKLAITTSGDYERYFEEDGKTYHHIISPFTGKNVDNGIASTTIVSQDPVEADALSTGIFVMGLEAGMELIESLEEVEIVFVTNDQDVYVSSGLTDIFEIIDDDFTLQDF